MPTSPKTSLKTWFVAWDWRAWPYPLASGIHCSQHTLLDKTWGESYAVGKGMGKTQLVEQTCLQSFLGFMT